MTGASIFAVKGPLAESLIDTHGGGVFAVAGASFANESTVVFGMLVNQ